MKANNRNLVETVMGGVVLLVAASFVMFAYKSGSVKSISGYNVTAKFDRADGVSTGSDVRVSGIKVGSVIEQDIDPDTYLAIVKTDNRLMPLDYLERVFWQPATLLSFACIIFIWLHCF